MSADPRGPPSRDRELEELLRRLPAAKVDPAFRRRVWAAFSGGAGSRDSGSRLEREPRMGGRLEPEFEPWLATAPIAPAARGSFRTELRQAFVSGRIQTREPAPAAAEPRQASAPPRNWVRFAVLAAAAAAVLAVTFFLPEPPRWKARLAGPVRLAGEEFSAAEADRLAVALEANGELESLGQPVELSLADVLQLELLHGARLTLPGLPELDGATPIALSLNAGEVYLRTSGDYPGNPIRVKTPQAEVEIHGTTLGILVDDSGTCVCVCQGRVGISSELIPEGSKEVEQGMTYFLFQDSAMGAKYMPFATEVGTPEYEHVRELEVFGAR